MRKRYCFFDFDGTLRSKKMDAVPSSAMKALDELKEAGHFIALATGRLQSDALAMIEPFGIDNMVADGGNSITLGGKLVSMQSMPLHAVRDFVHRLDEQDFAWAVNTANERVCLTPDSRYLDRTSNLYYQPVIVEDLDIDHVDPIYKIFVACASEDEERIDFTGVTKARCIPDILYIEPTNKAEGIKKMMEMLGAPLEDVIVFGDGTNDVGMFLPQWECVAMGNAIKELKAKADLVTTDVDHDGIWNACVQLGLIG